MTDVRELDGPFRAFLDEGFAGPWSRWRAVNVDDGATWEAYELMDIPARANPAQPRGTDLRLDADGLAWVLAPSAGGATAGEIVDASVLQGARLDASFAVHILAAVAPEVLRDELRWETASTRLATRSSLDAVSLDHVLVGFDGSVHACGHLPWWGDRRRARVERAARGPELVPSSEGTENIRMFGELAAELLSTKRWPVPGLMFPALSKKLRREARRVLSRMLEDTLVPAGLDEEELMDARHDVDLRALREEVAHLRMHAETVDIAALGGLVQNLFVERWEREQRTRSFIASF